MKQKREWACGRAVDGFRRNSSPGIRHGRGLCAEHPGRRTMEAAATDRVCPDMKTVTARAPTRHRQRHAGNNRFFEFWAAVPEVKVLRLQRAARPRAGRAGPSSRLVRTAPGSESGFGTLAMKLSSTPQYPQVGEVSHAVEAACRTDVTLKAKVRTIFLPDRRARRLLIRPRNKNRLPANGGGGKQLSRTQICGDEAAVPRRRWRQERSFPTIWACSPGPFAGPVRT